VTVIGDRQILVTAIRDTPVYVGPPGELERGVRTSHAIILPYRITDTVRGQLRDEATRALAKARAWIAVARTDEHWRFIAEMSALFRDLPTVYVNLGSPYRTIDAGRLVSVLTYSSSGESQRAAADVISGTTTATGVLPLKLAPPTATAEPDLQRPR
jgi:hypothetical protein